MGRREEFTARRRHMDFTQESLAHHLNVAVSTVTKWEAGTRLPAQGIRRNLAASLELSLMELDRLLGIEPRIELSGHRVPRWLNTYESLVLEAGQLGEVEFIAVPGLLQTKAYAEAVERTTELPLSDSQILERIDLRLARQSALHREPDPLQLLTLLSEGVLRDPVGDNDVMAEQLDHLLGLAERPNVELRILGPGQAPAAISGFELLTRSGDVYPFMAVTASVDGPTYIDVEDRVAKFVARFNHLTATALDTHQSTRRIEAIRKTYR